MRILLALGTSTGGVGRHVHDLCSGLVEAGHDVVVAGPPDVLETFGFAALGAAVHPLQVTDRPHPVRDLSTIGELRRLAAGADVVHAHGLRVAALTVLALRGVAGRNAPLVATLHNAAPGSRGGALIHRGLERVVAAGADLALGVSSDLVASLRDLGARRAALAVVPAAAAPSITHDRYAVRSGLGIEASVPLLVTVGRLAPQKDLDLLLDAVGLVTTRHDLDVVSVIAGEGPLREHLARRIATEGLPVRLLGHRTDIPDLLAAADVVVSSARWEGQPVGLQEALHVGAAIVATDGGGTADVVQDAALLVPVGDVESLASALADVLRHGGVRDDLRSKAVERAATLPDREAAIEAALTAYASVIDGQR